MPKARSRIPVYVQGPDGRPLAGAQVYVRTDPGGADATIYASRTPGAAATLPNPATTGADGRVPGYLERDDYAGTVTAPGMDPYVENFPIAPSAADAIDADWIDDDNPTAGLVAVRQADGSIAWARADAAGVAPGNAPTIGDYKMSAQGADHGDLGGGRFAWLKCDARETPASQTEFVAFLNALAPVRPFGTGAGGRGLLPDGQGRVPVIRGTHAEVDALGDSDNLAVGSRKIRHRHGKGTLNIASSGVHAHTVGVTVSAAAGTASLSPSDQGAAQGTRATYSSEGQHTHPSANFAGEVGDTGGPLDMPAHIVLGHLFIRAV